MSRIERRLALWLCLGALWLSAIPVMMAQSIESDLIVIPWLIIGVLYVVALLRFLSRPDVEREYEKRILSKKKPIGVCFSVNHKSSNQGDESKILEYLASEDYLWVRADSVVCATETIDAKSLLTWINDHADGGTHAKLVAYPRDKTSPKSECPMEFFEEFLNCGAEIMHIVYEGQHYRIICKENNIIERIYRIALEAECMNVAFVVQLDPCEPLDPMNYN